MEYHIKHKHNHIVCINYIELIILYIVYNIEFFWGNTKWGNLFYTLAICNAFVFVQF